MNKWKVFFLLYLIVSAEALNCPEGQGSSNCLDSDTDRSDEIHSIDIRMVKEKLTAAYQEIKPILEDMVADIAPSIHETIHKKYLPAIQSFRDETMPFLKSRVYPQIQKYCKFGLKIAEKFIAKVYKSYQLSNSTHLAIVSISDLIDEVYNEVKPILDMGKYLSTRAMSRGRFRGKRQVSQMLKNPVDELAEVAMIDIQIMKDTVIRAFRLIRPLLEDLLLELAPTVREKLSQTYLPKFQEIKQDVIPLFHARIYPHVEKYMDFAHHIADKLYEKIFTSVHLSNYTHINSLSLDDVIKDVYEEMKPVWELAHFLSIGMGKNKEQHYRGKRDLSNLSERPLIRRKRQMPDLLMAMMSPFVDNFVHSLSTTFFGGSDSLLSKVVLPVIYSIMVDPESRYDVMSLYMSAKSAFSPLLWEMMKRQSFNTPAGTVIKVPRHMFESAIARFRADGRPILYKLLNKHLQPAIKSVMDSSSQVVQFIDHLIWDKYDRADILKDQYLAFVNKHRNMFKTSTNTHVHYYPINEIVRDLKPIKISAFNLILQYMRRNPDSLVNTLFGENSILQRVILGTPTYARPSGNRG